MENEIKDLTPEQEAIVDAYVDFQRKLLGLLESSREIFKMYGNSQAEIQKLHAEIIDSADIADGLAKQMEIIIRRSRKETGLNGF